MRTVLVAISTAWVLGGAVSEGLFGCVPLQPEVEGEWSRPINLWAKHSTCKCDGTNFNVPNPCYEIAHATLISSGPKEGWVLFWRSDPGCGAPTYVWLPPNGSDVFSLTVPRDPATAPYPWMCESPPNGCWNDLMSVFCSGHSYLGDGRLVVAGGNDGCPPSASCGSPGFTLTGTYGRRSSWIFDPSVLTGSGGGWAAWTPIPGATQQRWYCSAVTLANGSVLLSGGVVTECSGLNPAPPWVVDYQDTLEVLPAWAPTSWTVLADLTPPIPPGQPLELTGTEAMRSYPHLRLLTGSPPGVFPTSADLFLAAHQGGIL